MPVAVSAAPEGGLPYRVRLTASVAGATLLAIGLAGVSIDSSVYIYMMWLAGVWTFLWSIGWLASSFARTGIGTARKSHLAFLVLVVILPWPVLAILSIWSGDGIWVIYPLSALSYGVAGCDMVFLVAADLWIIAAMPAYSSLLRYPEGHGQI